MILLSLDFETTGLDVNAAEVTEVGAVLYSTGQKRSLESAGFLVKTQTPLSQEVIDVTGIHPKMLEKFGYPSRESFDTTIEMYEAADAVIGQNVIRFDKLVLEHWASVFGIQLKDKLWIDTRTDLPGVVGGKLKYMLADAGVINPFPHTALADCLGVLTLVEQYIDRGKFNLDQVIERAKSPTIVLVSKQDRTENHLAKKRGFRWNPDYKIWWKTIKELDFSTETTDVPFPIAIAPSTVLIEKLWYD